MREFHGEWVRATPPRHRNGVIGMKHVRRLRLEQEAETTKGKKRRTRLKAGARFPAAHRARGQIAASVPRRVTLVAASTLRCIHLRRARRCRT
jgi:hypothetical protein